MTKQEFLEKLSDLFPTFAEYWEAEDIHKEEDGTYTAHGLMSSFFHFFKENHSLCDEQTLHQAAVLFEEIVESDPNDKSEVANAICTSFLELLDEQKEGRCIEKYLGKECKTFLDAMRGYS